MPNSLEKNNIEYNSKVSLANELLRDSQNFYLQTAENIGKLGLSILGVSITIFLTLYEKLEKIVNLELFYYLWLLFLLSSTVSLSVRYLHSLSLNSQAYLIKLDLLRNENSTENSEVLRRNEKKENDRLLFIGNITFVLSIISFLLGMAILVAISYQIIY